ncbi:MAG: hypothetical protein AAFN79_21295 [Pseudomonadota bacterium]
MTLANAAHLHHQTFDVEVRDGVEWKPFGALQVLPDGVFHNGDRLDGAKFKREHNAVLFNSEGAYGVKVGRLDFTHRGQAFVGVMNAADGSTVAIRGAKGYDEIFDTTRAPKGGAATPWETFEIKTYWRDEFGQSTLKVMYKLGNEDVSDRTRVTHVDRKTGVTSLEMIPSLSPLGAQDSFDIQLAFGGKSFSGTYKAADGTEYDWTGALQQQHLETLAAALRPVAAQPVPKPHLAQTAQVAAREAPLAVLAPAPGSTLSVQDLNNVSSIISVTDNKGKEITIDQAQTTAGEYFNKCLVNGLDSEWIDGIFGQPYSLNADVTAIFNDHKAFFQSNSVLATGTILKTSLSTDKTHGGAIQKISQEKLDAAWKELSSSKASMPDYQAVTSTMYVQGYHDGVAGIQPYIADGAAKWGKAYYEFLTDESTLLTWQIQIASDEFKNIKTRMYEWHTKLSVLAPDETYAKDMLGVAYSALLGVMYTKMRWEDDIAAFLKEVLDGALKGDIDFQDDVAKHAAEEERKLLEHMVTSTGIGLELADIMSNVISTWQRKNPNQNWADYLRGKTFVDDVHAALVPRDPAAAAGFKNWADQAGTAKAYGVLGGLLYMGAAAFLIYTIASQSGQDVTVEQVVEDINMGVLALAAFLKGVQKIFTLGLGAKMITWAGDSDAAFAGFAKNIATWFSEDGAIEATSTFGKAMTRIFGDNIAEFLGSRLGPVLAVFGLVLSAWFLYDAIQSGDVANIVFQALNAVVALAGAIALGFELASFAMAGPVGLVIAAIGLIIAVVQLIYNLVNPPKPPKDPIQKFVEGPMAHDHLTT